MVIRTSDELWLKARALEGGLLNLRTIRYQRYDGILVSMQQSGTRWIRYMLTLVLARLHDLELPDNIQGRTVVGKPRYPQTPQIRDTTMSPHYFLRSRTLFRLFRVPNHLILVRNLRDTLVSRYEKLISRYEIGKSDYKVDFSTYLRGDVRRSESRVDIWSRIRFLNGWGAVVERQPEHVAVLKYEDLQADTRGQLARVCEHFGIEGVTPDLIDDVVAVSSKSEMAKRGGGKPGSIPAVRMDSRPAEDWFSDEDRRFFVEVCRRHLKYTFGYRYW